MAQRTRFTDALAGGLMDWGLESFVHVPSSHVAPIIRALQERGVRSYLANREEEGVGIAGGLVLGGCRSALLMQDNGFGNSLTALTTFAAAYHVPLPVIANRRGGLGEYNSMIHSFSTHVPAMLSAVGLPIFELDPSDPPEVWRSTARSAAELATTGHRPVVVLADVLHPAGAVLG